MIETHIALKCLAALAHNVRLQIYRTLAVAGAEGKSPGQMVESLRISGATLSFHLKELSNANLIDQRREGKQIFYTVNATQMDDLMEYLALNCRTG